MENPPAGPEEVPVPVTEPPCVPTRMDPESEVLIEYITRFQRHCDKYLAPLADPRGKRVFIVGVGHGTEALWCIGRGAREIAGVDVKPANTSLIEEAARRLGHATLPPMDLKVGGIESMSGTVGGYDLVLSNNVFEHLPDVRLALSICADLCGPEKGMISVFAAPLFYSSAGSHFPGAEPWEHLWGDLDALRERCKDEEWEQYETLNRMTIADVLSAIRANQLLVERFEALKDRNWNRFHEYAGRIDPAICRTDLCVEGFSAVLRP